MKQIEWVGRDLVVPMNGIATKGRVLSLPDKTANSFIKQGLAKPVEQKPNRKSEETK